MSSGGGPRLRDRLRQALGLRRGDGYKAQLEQALGTQMRALDALRAEDRAEAATREHRLGAMVERILAARLGESRSDLESRDKLMLKSLVELGRTLNIVRQELLLVYERPAGTPTAAATDGEPQILRDYVAGTRMKEVYPTDLFPGLDGIALPIASMNEESGHVNHADLLYVAAIAQLRQARNIFEFGTYQGRTTYFLTFASPDARVTTLNLPPEQDPSVAPFLGIMFRGSDREDRITQLLQDSRLFDAGPHAASMDYVFVDGDHSYELVKNDTEKALAMLRPGGMIVWHDYMPKCPGVMRYIRDFAEERPVFRLRNTSLVVYIDGVDPLAFTPPPRRPSWVSKGAGAA